MQNKITARASKIFAAVAVLATVSVQKQAFGALFWDQNGSLGGTGTWDTTNTTQNWRTTATNGAADSKWNPNDGTVDASFNTLAAIITIGNAATVNAKSISFLNTAGNFSIGTTAINSGATLNLNNATQSITMQTSTTLTNGQAINASVGGTDITVFNNVSNGLRTLLNLNSANSFTGSLILGGTAATGTSLGNSNQVSLGNANSLGGVSNTNDVKFARNFSNLLFTSGGNGGAAAYTASYANDIDLNSTGSTGANGFTSAIGSAVSGTVITLNGVIKGTGDANLIFSNGLAGGQGKIILANHETYSGTTAMTLASTATTSGIVALGIDDALPTGTRFTLGNPSGAPSGSFDMAGHNQKVKALESVNGGTTNIGYIGGITNTSPNLSTLTVSGNLTTTFGVPTSTVAGNTSSANIGATTITGVAGLTGSNNNIALLLDSANTGQLTFVRPVGNTYSGGTTINGGTLVVNNTSGSGTGSGNVVIGGGKLTGTGLISGDVTVNSGTLAGSLNLAGLVTVSGGDLAPGSSPGTLTMGSSLSLSSGAYDYQLNTTTLAADLVNVASGLNIDAGGAMQLNLTDDLSAPVPLGTKFTLISYGGAWNGGVFPGYADGSLFTVGLNGFQINYSDTPAGAVNGGTQAHAVTLVTSAVPEPTTMGLMSVAGLSLLRRRRRSA